MRRLRRILLLTAIAIMATAGAPSVFAKGWEPVKSEKTQGQKVISDSEVEIRSGSGTIFITTSKNVNIKIFTILGSRIAEDNLAPGTYQFAVPTHGVFIIKAGTLTCKVAL